MLYQNILVPFDDSEAALAGLKEACRIGLHTGAVLHIVHVIDLAQFVWSGATYLHTDELAIASSDVSKSIFKRSEGIVAEFPNLNTHCTVLEAVGEKVASLLVHKLEEWECDLVVMGTHGFSGVKHLLMGSVAQDVIRQAGVPVTVIRVAS